MHTHKLSKIYCCDVHTLSVIIWTVGLITGIYVGTFISESLASAIYHSCFVKNSCFVPMAILPITLTFIAVRFSLRGMIYPILFFKAFFDGVILLAVGRCFGSASWLIGIPALFSDRVSVVFLLHYSIRCLTDRSYRFGFWYFIFLLLTMGMILLDHHLISGNLISWMR